MSNDPCFKDAAEVSSSSIDARVYNLRRIMPEHHRGQQQSPSPSSKTGSMLPPLSKYYYGPAQGWNSTESSPSHNGMQ